MTKPRPLRQQRNGYIENQKRRCVEQMKTRVLVILLVFAFVLSGCQAVGSFGNQKVYRFAETADATTLNPHQALASLEDSVLSYIMGALYRSIPSPDGKGAKLIPELAASEPVKMDQDGKVWQIKVSPNAVWENGDHMNADTFMYSWKMQLDPLLLNPTANTFYQYYIEIKNAQAYFLQAEEGKPKVAWEDVGIKKIDDMTVQITTTQRYNASEVMRHLTSKSSKPVYEPWYEKYMNSSRTATTYGTEKAKLMCCGPFVLESWVKGSERVYAKNPSSTVADLIKLDKIKVSVIKDAGTAMQMFLAGEIDSIDLTADTLEKYGEDPRTKTYPSRTVYFLDMNMGNTKNPILGNMNFRKAFYWALDRDKLATLTKQMPAPYYMHHTAGGYPDQGILYRDLPQAQALVNPNGGYDPAKALTYFNAAIKEMKIKGKVVVDIMYSDASQDTKVISEYIQKALPEIFGTDKFEITLTAAPSASFSATKRSWSSDPNAYQMAWGSWSNSSTLVYPNTQFKYFASSYSSRSAPYNNKEFDRLFDLSSTEEYRLNQDKLLDATFKMEGIFLNDVMAVPVFEIIYKTMFSPRLILAVDKYDPEVGWATMFSDIGPAK